MTLPVSCVVTALGSKGIGGGGDTKLFAFSFSRFVEQRWRLVNERKSDNKKVNNNTHDVKCETLTSMATLITIFVVTNHTQ